MDHMPKKQPAATPEMCAAYTERYLPLRECAVMFGESYGTMRRKLLEAGVVLRGVGSPAHRRNLVPHSSAAETKI